MHVLKWEGNLWIPSLYMGLLPFGLAVSAWSVRRQAAAEQRWASWMALLAGLASLGQYGLAWLIGLPFGGAHLLDVGGEVGGVYWLLTVLLPGYVYFRFPAKLFVVAALGLSLLAARGWDAFAETGRAQRLVRFWAALIVLSVLALGAVPFAWPYIEAQIHPVYNDVLLGPFDSSGSRRDLLQGLVHGLVVAALLLALVLWAQRGTKRMRLAGLLALGMTVTDLALTQSCLMLYAPTEVWQSRIALLEKLPGDRDNYRVYRQLGVVAPAWESTTAADRFVDYIRWNRATLSPKFEMPCGVLLAEGAESVITHDYSILLDVARNRSARLSKGSMPAESILDLIAARVAIVKPDMVREDIQVIDEPAQGLIAGLRPTALPRAWLTHDVETLPELTSRSMYRVKQRTLEIFYPNQHLRDLRGRGVVESNLPLDPLPAPAVDASRESCELASVTPTLISIDVRLTSPGLLVLSDLYYPGWKARVETDGVTREAPIVRTNRVMRGVALPAGAQRVVFSYEPRSLYYGGIISASTTLALGLLAIVACLRRHGSATALTVSQSPRNAAAADGR
jgi:hypothetical protein